MACKKLLIRYCRNDFQKNTNLHKKRSEIHSKLGSGHKVSAIWGWMISQKSSKKIDGPILDSYSLIYGPTPLFMDNLPKKGPLFREFGARKAAHMGGTYPYPQHVMYPPPPGHSLNTLKNDAVAKFEPAFTRHRNNLKTVGT